MDVKEYINSNYKLVKSLKRDGSVMIAKCTIDDGLYVVKNKKAYDSEIYNRLKEADIDGIPKVYEVLEDKGGLWIIEEFVQGRTLEEFFGDDYLADVTGEAGLNGEDDAKASNGVDSNEAPDNVLEVSFDTTGVNGIKTENDAAEWMLTNVILSVSKTLNKLHTLKPPIIHRDIKPENIIITDLAEIKLLDFNISRGFTGTAEKDTVAMGTKGFAPPEQYGFKESDARSDIYSLGATIKYLMEKTRCESEMLSEFVKKAMSFDPKNRFQNMIEVIYFIKHYDDDEVEDILEQAGEAAGSSALSGLGSLDVQNVDEEKLKLAIENKRLELEKDKANNRLIAFSLVIAVIIIIILFIAM